MMTAMMAPGWIATSNAFMTSESGRPSSDWVRIRWPVDDTGRNSVSPSTMPMMAALISSNVSTLDAP